MRVHLQQVGSVDAHKKTAVATRMRVNEKEVDGLEWETETFGTTTPELLKLHDWLQEWGCSHVVIESTGDYWKPIFNLLEGSVEVWLVNAKHVHNLPGRKTDVTDSEWLAELMMYGLLRPSFIPPKPQRALRDLTRYRTRLIQERARTVNRVQKLLEGANIKLASVVSDVMGVSAREMLAAIVDGGTDAALMADLARGRLRNKLPELEKALTGLVQPHHRFLLATQLSHIDFLGEQIEAISAEIGRQLEAMDRPPGPPRGNGATSDEQETEDSPQEEPLTWAQAIAIVKSHPGIDSKAAEDLLAEFGIHVESQFPSASHFTSWLGLCPGNNESGGKRRSGRTRQGNTYAKSLFVQVAWSAIRVKDSVLKERYHRLARRWGKKRAIVAIARSIAANIWYMLSRRQPHQELGGDFYDQRDKESKVGYLVRRLEKLTGGTVSVELLPAAAA